MSRKSFMEQACALVPEFKNISETFLRKYTVAGKSSSCIRNYLIKFSEIVVHVACTPLQLSIDQMEQYLFAICQNEKPSLSSFKHLEHIGYAPYWECTSPQNNWYCDTWSNV
ncbi:MAG: hypothetical protein ACWA6U_18070 [Breznakibacter sp.]